MDGYTDIRLLPYLKNVLFTPVSERFIRISRLDPARSDYPTNNPKIAPFSLSSFVMSNFLHVEAAGGQLLSSISFYSGKFVVTRQAAG